MLTSGLVLGGAGIATVLFLGLPAYGLRNNALDNARAEKFYAEEQRFIRRARRRHNFMIATMAVGGAFTVSGIVLTIVGGASKASIRNELSLAPSVGPTFAGGTLRLRF